MGQPLITPLDEHNQALLANVHPADWQNPTPRSSYHLVVIGAGAGGLIASIGAATVGARVAIIERGLMGGDCLNVGCVPSKGVIRAARALHDTRTADEFGVRGLGEPKVDFAAMMERMRRLRARISDNDSVHRLKGLGIDVFLGEARFTSPRSVVVDGAELHFKKAVIASGGRPFVPDIPGMADTGYLTNETVFNLTEQPRRLLVLGGGPIGTELAQSFRRFGSEVTIVARDDHFLSREDADAAQILQERIRGEGITFHFKSTLASVEATAGGKRAIIRGESGDLPVEVDEILVAVGRQANIESLELDAAGVATDNRRVQVSPTLQTTNRRIYAVGDVALPYQFTHVSGATGALVVQNALFQGRKKWTDLVIPWTTFTDPEIAHVGLYAHQAEAQGIACDTYKRELAEVDRAILDGDEEGFVKVVVRKGSDRILGATIVAGHAGEMINELTLAISQKIGLKQLAGTIHPYPTQAEAIPQAGAAYLRSKLTPKTKLLLKILIKLLN